jgi:hypothetical protein
VTGLNGTTNSISREDIPKTRKDYLTGPNYRSVCCLLNRMDRDFMGMVYWGTFYSFHMTSTAGL